MDPPELPGGSPGPPGAPGNGPGAPRHGPGPPDLCGPAGLPMFGPPFSSHFLSGLQSLAGQGMVEKFQSLQTLPNLQNLQNLQNLPNLHNLQNLQNLPILQNLQNLEDEEEEDEEPHEDQIPVEIEKVYTDNLKSMCEYTCQICGKIMNAYYLRKHVRDHNMSMTTYKELYGKVQFTKLSFHRCRICQNVIKANYITIMKHLKCVHNVSFKDYKNKFNIFIGKESKQMFKESELELESEIDRNFSDKAQEMCKVSCKICNSEYPTHQFRFHVKSKHKLNFNEYREKNGALEIQNRVYHRCKVCFKVLLFQYEKLASHVTDSHGIKMSAYVRLYLEKQDKVPKALKSPKKKEAKVQGRPRGRPKTKELPPEDLTKVDRPRTRRCVKEEEGIEEKRFIIKRELEEILMDQEIGVIEDSEEETRRSRRKKPRKKYTKMRRRLKSELDDFSIRDIKEELFHDDMSELAHLRVECSPLNTIKMEITQNENENEETEEVSPRAVNNLVNIKNQDYVGAVSEDDGNADDLKEKRMIGDEVGNGNDSTENINKSPTAENSDVNTNSIDDIDESKSLKLTPVNHYTEFTKDSENSVEMVFSDNPEEICLCKCSFCSKIIPYDLLRKHVTSKHGKVKDDYGEYKYIRLTYHRCKKCNLEILFSYNNIKLHLNRFHKLSINEYQTSLQGFTGKMLTLRTLKALYNEEDGVKPEKSQGLKRALINQMRGVKPQSFDQLDRSQDPGLMSPDRERSPEKDRRWFDGNTFSCLDSSCKFSSYCLDNFEKHVQSEHRVSLEAFKGEYRSTEVTMQCEYCGESVYHEYRSLLHHLNSHYLTLDQYQTHYIRIKIDETSSQSKYPEKDEFNLKPTQNSPPSPILDENPSSTPTRIQSTPTPDSQNSTNNSYTETSTLLDHLKRSDLFSRTFSDTRTESQHFSESYRSSDPSFPSSDPYRSFNESRVCESNDEDVYRGLNYDQIYPRSASSTAEPSREVYQDLEQRRNQFSPNPGFANSGLPIDYSQHVSQRETYPASSEPVSYISKNGDYLSKNNDAYPDKEIDYSIKDNAFTHKDERYNMKDEDYTGKNGLDSYKDDARTQMKTHETYFRYVTSQLQEYYNRRQTGEEEFNRRQHYDLDFNHHQPRDQEYSRDLSLSADVFLPEFGREVDYSGSRGETVEFVYRRNPS